MITSGRKCDQFPGPTSNTTAGFFGKTFSEHRLQSTFRKYFIQHVPSCNWAGLSQPSHILERVGSFLNEHRAKSFGDPHPCALPLCLLELFLDCCDRCSPDKDRVGKRVQSSTPDTKSFTAATASSLSCLHHPHGALFHPGSEARWP